LAVLFLGNWIPFELFGVHIPLADALMLMPVVMLAASLPITPQGVGTRDAVALQLFAGFASGTASERAATLAAATLSFAISLTLVQLVLSPLFLAPARRLLASDQISDQPARPSP
ncbi:MAG TPA: lysylphosphatidylglycerol synthase domain-containing protein, partial [Polyangiaceae bacterium]|nr:lysylphosphatidylglycerol synthase domain-containing protein [Polyangiaceae bacterium]